MHRHDGDERLRASQLKRLHHEPNGHARIPRQRMGMRVVLGILLGSLIYLVTSCYYENRLHQPKFERRDFRFDHRPDRPN